MKKILKSLASDIADKLTADLEELPSQTPGATGIGDWLVDELAGHVAQAINADHEPIRKIAGPVDPGHQALEHRGVDLNSVDGKGDVKAGERGTSFPNLKYAKPKYKNVDSVLKYIEETQDTGGIKLVIMNFND